MKLTSSYDDMTDACNDALQEIIDGAINATTTSTTTQDNDLNNSDDDDETSFTDLGSNIIDTGKID